MIGLWLLVVIASVVMAQDRTAEFNTVQCEAFRNVVAASFLPSSPCFNKNGGQIGINKRADETRVAQCRFQSACLDPEVAPPNVTMLSADEQAELYAVKCPNRPYQDTSFCSHIHELGMALCEPNECLRNETNSVVENEYCIRNSTCNIMLNSYAQWCTAVKDRDLLQAFPKLGACNATPSEIVTIDIGLNFVDLLPFPIVDSFLPVVRDPNGAVCNGGSRGCPCVVAVNNTRAVAATDDTKGECAYGLECRNLTCIGVADEGFQDAAKLKAAYGAASLLAPSTAMLLVIMLLSVGH